MQFSDRYCKFPTEFRQTAANFRQSQLWMTKILILSLNVSKMGSFQPQILRFSMKDIGYKESFLTAQNLRG